MILRRTTDWYLPGNRKIFSRKPMYDKYKRIIKKKMKKYRYILLLLFLAVLTAGAQDFSIDGTRFLDPDGNEFVPKGTNVNGPYWPWGRSTVADTALIINRWKFNTIRVNCLPRLKYTFPDNNPDLDAIVDCYTSREIVTIIENHDYGGGYPQGPDLDDLKNWWIDKANRYKDNPWVWFNIMNEPGPNVDTVPVLWKTTHETVIQAIRNEGAGNIIILDGHQYGQENAFSSVEGSGILTYGPYFVRNYSNIGFSVHLYSRWNYKRDRFDAYVDSAHSRNLCLHVGEYGSAYHYCKGIAADIFRVAIPEKIGRIVWQWDGTDVHDLTREGQRGGGWEITGTEGEKPDNLSYVGNLVWEDNHGRLTSGSSELTDMPGPWVYNGGFEDENREWITFGGYAFTASAGNVHSGQKALRINAGSDGGAVQTSYLMPDSVYIFSAWGRMSGTGASGDIAFRYTPGGGEKISHTLRFTGTGYTKKEIEFTMGSDPESASLLVYKGSNDVALYADDISIVLKSEQDASFTGELEMHGERIFPNPATDRCYVPLGNMAGVYRIRIIDVAGRVHDPPVRAVHSNKAEIGLKQMKPGVYLVEVEYPDSTETYKLIISK